VLDVGALTGALLKEVGGEFVGKTVTKSKPI